VERAQGFSGWDFSLLRTRELGEPWPWDYARTVAERARGASTVLDLGTGGGERLAEMRAALPSRMVATEEWHVNAPIARERLRPLGVEVVRADSDLLPLRSGSFDLVISRHEDFTPADLAKVLRPGGWFVTQQVYKHDWQEINRHFGAHAKWGDHLERYTREFEALGFEVTSRHNDRPVAYPSLGEFVYMLCVAPWEIEDFDVERDLDRLLALERECLTEEGFLVTECRYLMVARKPA
jgi:SAM-dependent methyltransferase